MNGSTRLMRSRRKRFIQKKAVPIQVFDQSVFNNRTPFFRVLRIMENGLGEKQSIAFEIFSFFTIRELILLGQVCKRFYELVGQQELINTYSHRTLTLQKKNVTSVPDFSRSKTMISPEKIQKALAKMGEEDMNRTQPEIKRNNLSEGSNEYYAGCKSFHFYKPNENFSLNGSDCFVGGN
jgi:hypothetical protein